MPLGMQLQVRITGAAELERKLQALPDRVAKKVLGAAMRSGATIIKRQAISNIHRLFKQQTGNLARSIIVRSFAVSRHGLRFDLMVGTALPTGAHGHLLEFGHRTAGPKKLTRVGQRARVGDAPATAFVEPRPFLEPAFKTSSRQALAKIEQRLRAGVEREAARARSAAKW